MKIIKIIILLSLLALNSVAQNYMVYTTKGNIVSKQHKVVKVGTIISSKDYIIVEKNSRLVILAEKEKRLYTISSECSGDLEILLKGKECSIRNLADTYLQFIKRKIQNTRNIEDKNYMQSAGNAYRETDSINIKLLIDEENIR